MAKDEEKHSKAAQSAQEAAGKHSGAGAGHPVSGVPNIEAFKKLALSNPDIQKNLGAAKTEADFISRIVTEAKQHNVPFTADQAQAYLDQLKGHGRKLMMASETGGGGGGGTGGGGGGGGGCSSKGTSSGAYSLNCGFKTQTCLCTL